MHLFFIMYNVIMISSFINYILGYNKTNTNTSKYNNKNKIDKLCKKLPFELKNIILEYEGSIEYRYKKKKAIDYHKFVNKIHKHDERYNVIIPIINKKKKIMEDTDTIPNDTRFYFEFSFDKQSRLFLCYDYNWSYDNVFEICYTDMKGSNILGSDQIRTII